MSNKASPDGWVPKDSELAKLKNAHEEARYHNCSDDPDYTAIDNYIYELELCTKQYEELKEWAGKVRLYIECVDRSMLNFNSKLIDKNRMLDNAEEEYLIEELDKIMEGK